jgi:autophagy-related protein 13
MRLGTSAGSKRVSLNTLPQQALRAPPSMPNDNAIASSGSSSPKPTPLHRYSSSFAGRTKRFISPGSKTAESNISSGRNSSSSKEKPTGQFISGTPGSSGSGQTDEDDIAAFISQVESAKDLRSLHSRPASRGNTVNLAKYSMMRDPGLQLAEEMSSSSLIQSSVTPPSRRLSNVPGLSISSSPSRALAHQPHVRSRLSTHSIAEEISGASGVSGASGASGEGLDSPKIQEEEEDEDDMPFIFASDQI